MQFSSFVILFADEFSLLQPLMTVDQILLSDVICIKRMEVPFLIFVDFLCHFSFWVLYEPKFCVIYLNIHECAILAAKK